MIFSGDLRVSNARGVGLVTSPGGFRWVKANRPLSLLVTSRAISFVGSSMGLIALLLYLFGLEFAVAGVSALLLVGDFLPALLAPLLGTLADRVELRRLMLICKIGQAAATAAIAWWLPAVPLLLGIFTARAVLGQIFMPASRAAIPALVIDAELPGANAAVGFGENGIPVLGPLLAASPLPLLGVRGLLLVDAATFLGSAALLSFLPRLPAQELELGEAGSFIRHAGRGVRSVWRAVGLRTVIISFAVVGAFSAVDDVALVFLAGDELGATRSGTSLLYGGAALGLLVGYLIIGRRVWAPVAAMLVTGYALNSLGNLFTGFAGSVVLALLLQTIRGLGIAAQDVAASTFIQRGTPRSLQGRTFSLFYGAIGLAAGVSYLLGGVLLAVPGPRTTFVVVGLGGLSTAAITAVMMARGHAQLGSPEPPIV